MSYKVYFDPHNPTLDEPISLTLNVKGEIVQETNIDIGFNHRGIEKLCTEKKYIKTLSLVERVCGKCSFSHSLAYVLALEEIAGIVPTKRADYHRVIMAELERIQSHYYFLGTMAKSIGFESAFYSISASREKLMDLIEFLMGNRIYYGFNIIGGVKRDFFKNDIDAISYTVVDLRDDNKNISKFFLNDTFAKSRLSGIGVLSLPDALDYGVEGPYGRASGVKFDVRLSDPYSSYQDFNFNLITDTPGDVLSRVKVKLLEVDESLGIVEQAIKNIPQGKVNIGFLDFEIPDGEYLSRVESPRGELSYYVVSREEDTPYRVAINTPSFRNYPSIEAILKGSDLQDVPVIINSMDICLSCFDR
ncbi:MAG: nickel-dependent hydrogenase large subunit [Oscillospiraceae bacterium]|nr:nickel-dependent hydrogenase large subunit [Oscillospiraceae bacterium]